MANYTIKSGDTLSDIAKKAGMSVLDLIAQNPQFANPNLIHSGEQVFISGKESSPAAKEAAANLMLGSQLPADVVAGITPSIEPGLATPQVDGLGALEDAYSTPQTYLGQLEALGISLPSPTQVGQMRLGGIQETAGFEAPTIPGAAKNVEQIKEELSKQTGYDVKGIQSMAGVADQLGQDPLFHLDPDSLVGSLAAFLAEKWNTSYWINRLESQRVDELRKQGMSELEAKEQARREFLKSNVSKTSGNVADPYAGVGPTDRTGTEEYIGVGPTDKAGSYYGLGSQPLTLPKNAEGESYLPSAFLKLSEQVQRGHRTDMEIAESLAERLMTAPNLAPLSENPPENILLNTGDAPNEAFVRIQQIILAYLEQEARAYPYDVDIQTIYAQFKNAGSLEEFYAMLNYGPSDIHPNIWTRQAGLLNENVLDPADVAASILSGQSFYDASRNPNLFGGGGGSGGRQAVSNSWGQASGGLYLWRIAA